MRSGRLTHNILELEPSMDVATAAATASRFLVNARKSPSAQSLNPNRSSGTCLSTSFVSSCAAPGSLYSGFAGLKLRPESLNPASISHYKPRKRVITMVIPFRRGNAFKQPPPDLASYFLKERIVYLGMCLVPAVTELLLAEFMYLQYDDPEKPIYMYINSTGTTKNGEKLGYEAEAIGVYDTMSYVKPPIFTLCVGNAWGEAALLLASGAKGNRSALPSSTIMIRQPMARFQGQATDVDIARREIKVVKEILVNMLATETGKSFEQIEADVGRPKYFSPSEAVEYGIIDKVLYTEKASEDGGVVSDLKKAHLIGDH